MDLISSSTQNVLYFTTLKFLFFHWLAGCGFINASVNQSDITFRAENTHKTVSLIRNVTGQDHTQNSLSMKSAQVIVFGLVLNNVFVAVLGKIATSR